ncbi:hypothetical protein NP493_237g03062 [Ridgeia piscesae]|uniref:Uncharacterized protein n=1 Tax=Ridgeia piscesae TaxID=27915 RepID=A0AAD9NZT8_RIDPI|nr:hypothetical protein NP493_237g03062 [Ridgeia piscesae]
MHYITSILRRILSDRHVPCRFYIAWSSLDSDILCHIDQNSCTVTPDVVRTFKDTQSANDRSRMTKAAILETSQLALVLPPTPGKQYLCQDYFRSTVSHACTALVECTKSVMRIVFVSCTSHLGFLCSYRICDVQHKQALGIVQLLLPETKHISLRSVCCVLLVLVDTVLPNRLSSSHRTFIELIRTTAGRERRADIKTITVR